MHPFNSHSTNSIGCIGSDFILTIFGAVLSVMTGRRGRSLLTRGQYIVTVAGCYLILLVLDRQKSVPAVISRVQEVTNKEKEEVTESLANRIENLIDIKSKLSSISDHDPQLLDYIQRKLVPPAPPNTELILAKEIHSGQVNALSITDYGTHKHIPNLPISSRG